MKRQTSALLIGAAALILGILLINFAPARIQQPTPAGNYRLSGPYSHENLTIFLVHGEDKHRGKKLLTLQEAMEQRKVVVHETRSVNELSVENVSRDEEVFIQAGDIVKGGQQDRVLSTDLVVPPRSGKVPVAAFCVEQGRWRRRGKEEVARFSTSDAQIATKDLKMAAKRAKSQGEVWNKVAEAQGKLSKNVGASVTSADSASSLQLTLENQKVRESADSYIKQLSSAPDGKDAVIGYVFAINGKINSADIYGSSALFRKLWPKLLRAAATEAIAELAPGTTPAAPVATADVETFLADAERGETSETAVNKRIKTITREGERHLLFETRDAAQAGGIWLHRNYLSK